MSPEVSFLKTSWSIIEIPESWTLGAFSFGVLDANQAIEVPLSPPLCSPFIPIELAKLSNSLQDTNLTGWVQDPRGLLCGFLVPPFVPLGPGPPVASVGVPGSSLCASGLHQFDLNVQSGCSVSLYNAVYNKAFDSNA